MNAVDGIGMFDREKEAVYVDTCCHYTMRGNDILADAIAAHLIEVM